EVAAPVARLVGGPGAGHAAADDQDVRVDVDRLSASEQTHYRTPCLNWSRRSRGRPPSILSASGSCASSWRARSSGRGGSYSFGALIDPQGVVRIGETKFFSRPSRNRIFQEIVPLLSSRSARTLCPSGAKSA